MRRVTHTVLAITASLLVTGAGTVQAQTDLLAGKRLLLKQSASKERLVVVSRDRLMAPIPGGLDDPTLRGATLDLGNPSTGEWVRFSIPAAGWRLNALGTVFRYQSGRPRAVGAVRTLVIRHQKRLKIRGTAIGIGLDEPAQGGLAVVLTTGSHRYCLLFDGGAVKRDGPGRFAARNAAAPAACPVARLVPNTTSSTFLPRPTSTTTSTTRTTQPLPPSTSTSSSSTSTRASSTVSTSTTSSTTTSTSAPTTSTSSSSTTTTGAPTTMVTTSTTSSTSSTTSPPPTTSTTSTTTTSSNPTSSTTSTSTTTSTIRTTSSTIATTSTSTTSTNSSITSTSTSSTTSTTGFTCGGFHLFCGGTCPPGTRCVGGLIVVCSCQSPDD